MANLLRLLATSLVLVTAVRAHGQYEDSSNRKPHSNLFVALTPSGQMFHKKPPSPSPQQVFHQLPDEKSPAGLPEENGYQIPWIDMMPRRENRGRRVKKLPGQSGGGHVQSKAKNSIPVDTNPTSREARGRDNNRYDVPLIECAPSDDGLERFACPTPDRMGRYRCIDDHMLCDGFIDCAAAEDEDRMSCMFYKTTKAHLDVLADALLRWARGRY
ncbi:unnamed protein product [Larinioides sclopetarius]|uniref:Uncharacterized protein n=1 Tax=Larinioides sclopetarius TaxID=280406 RepID=A0AAV1Z2R0_9ARAC